MSEVVLRAVLAAGAVPRQRKLPGLVSSACVLQDMTARSERRIGRWLFNWACLVF